MPHRLTRLSPPDQTSRPRRRRRERRIRSFPPRRRRESGARGSEDPRPTRARGDREHVRCVPAPVPPITIVPPRVPPCFPSSGAGYRSRPRRAAPAPAAPAAFQASFLWWINPRRRRDASAGRGSTRVRRVTRWSDFQLEPPPQPSPDAVNVTDAPAPAAAAAFSIHSSRLPRTNILPRHPPRTRRQIPRNRSAAAPPPRFSGRLTRPGPRERISTTGARSTSARSGTPPPRRRSETARDR